MNASDSRFDSARSVPGELSCLGFASPCFSFSFDDVIRAIGTLNGEEVSGLEFRHGTPLADDEIAAAGLAADGIRPLRMSDRAFCVGGGSDRRYICFIYDGDGPLWLRSRSGDPSEMFRVAYDSGCDTELGMFTGDLVATYDEAVQAARHFFLTEEPSPQLIWLPDAELEFDPWNR